jgi:hypothetical protein
MTQLNRLHGLSLYLSTEALAAPVRGRVVILFASIQFRTGLDSFMLRPDYFDALAYPDRFGLLSF